MTRCDEVREVAARLAVGDETIEPAMRRTIEEHIPGCHACATEVAGLRQAIDALRDDEPPDPGAVYWAAYQGRLRARIARVNRGSRMRAGLAIAASAIILAGVGLYSSGAIRTGDRTPATPSESVQSAQSARSVEARLEAILDRAAARAEDRIALEAILDDMVPADVLEIDDAIGTFSTSEVDEGTWEPFGAEG